MNKWLYSGLSLGSIILWRLMMYAPSSPGAAVSAAPHESLRTELASRIISQLGAGNLHHHDIVVLSSMVVLFSSMLGLLSHAFLGEKGFGRARNGIIILFGAVATAWLYHAIMGSVKSDDINVLVFAAVLGPICVLVLAVLAKQFIADEVESVLIGVDTRTIGLVRSLKPASPQPKRVAPLPKPSTLNHRMAQITRKR